METLSKVAAGGGTLHRIKHASTSTKTEMTFAIFVPGCVTGPPPGGWPVVYWLSGLTCDDTNFCTKAGAFGAANKEGVVLVMPDTSPRGAGVAGEDSSWDIGTGAGFYVDATAEPWKANYNMKTYVATELPALVEAHFACSKTLKSISGHSMGKSMVLGGVSRLCNVGEPCCATVFQRRPPRLEPRRRAGVGSGGRGGGPPPAGDGPGAGPGAGPRRRTPETTRRTFLRAPLLGMRSPRRARVLSGFLQTRFFCRRVAGCISTGMHLSTGGAGRRGSARLRNKGRP